MKLFESPMTLYCWRAWNAFKLERGTNTEFYTYLRGYFFLLSKVMECFQGLLLEFFNACLLQFFWNFYLRILPGSLRLFSLRFLFEFLPMILWTNIQVFLQECLFSLGVSRGNTLEVSPEIRSAVPSKNS